MNIGAPLGGLVGWVVLIWLNNKINASENPNRARRKVMLWQCIGFCIMLVVLYFF